MVRAADRLPFRVARDGFASLALNLISVALTFVTSVILSRLLGRKGFGVYVVALSWSTVLMIPALFGTVELLVRNITQYRAQQAWALVRGIMRRCNLLVLGASLLVVGAAAAGGSLVMADGEAVVRDSYLIALSLVPILALVNLRQAEMIAFQHIPRARAAETVAYPLLFLSLLGALHLLFGTRMSPPTAVGLNVAAATGALALASYLSRTTVPAAVKSAHPEYDRATWARSTPALLLISAMPALNAHSGAILLGAIADVDSAAIFSAALRLAAFTGFLQWACSFPLAPAIARLHATDEIQRLERLVRSAAVIVFLLSTPVAVALLLFGRRALTLYGEGFASGRLTLSILVVGELINLSCGLVGVLLVMTGHERRVAKLALVAVLANIALCMALIPLLGAVGAAIARASTTAGLNLVLLVVVWRRLRIYPAAFPRLWPGPARAARTPR